MSPPAQACQSGIVSGTTLMGIAAPLLHQVIIEGKPRRNPAACLTAPHGCLPCSSAVVAYVEVMLWNVLPASLTNAHAPALVHSLSRLRPSHAKVQVC